MTDSTKSNGGGHDAHGGDHGHHHKMTFLRKYVFSTDHKVIGLQYLFCGLAFFLVGGLMALLVRWQVAWPWGTTPGDPEAAPKVFPILGNLLFPNSGGAIDDGGFYNMAFTMHASVMIFLVIIPLLTGAFSNFLIPLMIGAKDMAFPYLNGLSFWTWFGGALVLASSFFLGGPEGGGYAASAGWTAYPPLSFFSPEGDLGQSLWCSGVIITGTASIMGSINYITTIINLRAPGMHMLRMPMTVWSAFITAILQLFATPVLSSAMAMLLFEKHLGTSFFLPSNLVYNEQAVDVAGGGQVILWQHLFWFYSHPAVYIMILPAMGIVSDLIACYSRKPLFGYKPMVYAISAIAGLGFVVWGHHMFQSGMNPVLGSTFMVSTIMIALPSAVKVFNWMGTLWKGSIEFSPPMLWALAFVTMFTIGGLSGIYMASAPVDIFIHDTYFIVAHIHYVLFTGSVMGIFGGICHWFPKMFGRHMNKKLNYLHFWGTFIFMNGTFFPMHIIGMGGYPRRYADYTQFKYLERFQEPVMGLPWNWNEIMTISAILLGLFQVPFMLNFLYSAIAGRKVTSDNPWHANSLEWSTASPAPHYNWPDEVPTVYHGPYEFNHPGLTEDYAPQWKPMQPAPQPAVAAASTGNGDGESGTG